MAAAGSRPSSLEIVPFVYRLKRTWLVCAARPHAVITSRPASAIVRNDESRSAEEDCVGEMGFLPLIDCGSANRHLPCTRMYVRFIASPLQKP